MIETIVLDLDGPLLDGVDRHYECYRRLLHGMGFQPISKQDYWHLKRSRIDRRSLLALSRAEACYDQFLDGWLQRIETPEMLAFDRLQPEALEILRSWRRCRIQLVLATMRNQRANTVRQLETLQLMPLFDHVCITGTCDCGGKAAAVRRHLQHSDKEVAQAIWIGDTEVDIQAAHQLELPMYAVSCGLRTGAKLREFGAERVFGDLREVRQAIDLPDEGSRVA